MIKFDYTKFFNEIDEALTIHTHSLDKKIFEAPNIHNKILRQFIIEKNKLMKLESDLNKVFGQKFHYYRYEYELKLDNKDVVLFYVKKDPDFLKANDAFNSQKLLVETIEKWMKKANSITFDIKNILEYLKWSSGN
jgi:hypothetical protein